MIRLIFFIVFMSSIYSHDSLLSDDLKYYPLETGNYFEYLSIYSEMPYPPDSSANSITVLGDTTLSNGKKYKILLNKRIPEDSFRGYTFERIDSTDGSVYRYKEDEYLNENEFKIDSLFAQTGDTIRCSREGFSSFGYFETICYSTYADTIFGIPTTVKEYFDQSFIPGLQYKLAKGFGFINSSACEFSCGVTSLVYAEIDGQAYGKTITNIEKDNLEMPKEFLLYQNYPNPFNPTTTISFRIPKQSFTELNIFDIKGSHIKTIVEKELSPGLYSFEIDCSRFSSGIYFYRLNTEDIVKTMKMVLLK